MTSEVVVMNRQALVMAADSAVTIGQGERIYQSANKLFALSKYAPIGVMIYNSANFVSVPFETLIKEYRGSLGENTFPSLEEYALDFIRFVETNVENIVPEEVQDLLFQEILNTLLVQLPSQAITHLLETEPSATRSEQIDAFWEGIEIVRAEVDQWNYLEGFDANTQFSNPTQVARIAATLKDQIAEFLESRDEQKLSSLDSLICDILAKDTTYSRFLHAGIVIGGFAENDMLPSVAHFDLFGIIGNKMRRTKISVDKVEHLGRAKTLHFADSDMVNVVRTGVPSQYRLALVNGFRNLSNGLLEEVKEQLGTTTTDQEAAILATTAKIEQKVQELAQQMMLFEHSQYSDPFERALDAMPKEELAQVADTLVNLNSFSKQVSDSQRTVGGPVDVCVISKGDGLVWIRRKHYFDPELNHSFFAKYYPK